MENQNISQPHGQGQPLEAVPNSTAVLVLGILSIVFSCWYFSIAGVVMGIIALVLASRANEAYAREPQRYTLGSIQNLKAGKTCAIIGVAVAAFFILVILMVLIGVIMTIPFLESCPDFN